MLEPLRYNIYGGDQDINAVFGDVKRFIRYVSPVGRV